MANRRTVDNRFVGNARKAPATRRTGGAGRAGCPKASSSRPRPPQSSSTEQLVCPGGIFWPEWRLRLLAVIVGDFVCAAVVGGPQHDLEVYWEGLIVALLWNRH